MSELTARRESWFDYLPGNWQQAVNTSPVLNALGRAFNRPSPNLERGIEYDQHGNVSDRNWLLEQARGGPPKLNPLAAEMLDKGGTLAMFLGPAAKTADLKALARAQTRTAAGVPREQVWKEDGWFQGPDGKWRFEVDDSAFRYAGETGRLGDVAPHPAMTAAYPDTAKIAIGALPDDGVRNARYVPRRDGVAGVWDRVVGASPASIDMVPGRPRTVLLHEMQHAVDDVERAIPRTSNPYNVADPLDRAALAKSSAYTDAPFEMVARATEHRANLTQAQRSERPPWLDYTAQDHPAKKPAASVVRRPDGLEVLPERAAAEAALEGMSPSTISYILSSVRSRQMTPEQARVWDTLTSSEWSHPKNKLTADAMRNYRNKTQFLGHNGGPPTTEWDDPFVYSLRSR